MTKDEKQPDPIRSEFDSVRMYKLADLEKILGINRRSLQNYIRKGSIKALRVGNKWMVPHEEVARILKEGIIIKAE